jgi:FAD/FMN-containing dehydrogenase
VSSPRGARPAQLDADETQRVREAYPPATLDRMRELKRRIDPDNVFRLNVNVVP